MDKSLILPPESDAPADPKVTKPPAESPLTGALEAFDALFLAALRRARAVPSADVERYLRHAFYAGARAAFNGVIDAMQETAEGSDDGEKRFEAIEREIDAYFSAAIAQAAVSPNGKAPT